jgi:hypothetical protein
MERPINFRRRSQALVRGYLGKRVRFARYKILALSQFDLFLHLASAGLGHGGQVGFGRQWRALTAHLVPEFGQEAPVIAGVFFSGFAIAHVA